MDKGMKIINNKQNKPAMFIKTQDLATAEGLGKAGFELIDYQEQTWTFLNNPNCPITFDNNKLAYSNMLCI